MYVLLFLSSCLKSTNKKSKKSENYIELSNHGRSVQLAQLLQKDGTASTVGVQFLKRSQGSIVSLLVGFEK